MSLQVDFDLATDRVDEQLLDGAGLIYVPKILSDEDAEKLFQRLRSSIVFEQRYVTLYIDGESKRVAQPRHTAWYADPGCSYRYGGETHEPEEWIDELIELRGILEAGLQATFNSVIANLYRDGSDSVAWHADDEVFVPRSPIASLSLGEERRFKIRHNESKQVTNYELPSGSLLVMTGTFQERYQHCVPKTKKPKDERINLTWRNFKSKK